jgi:hypothetical protein
MSSPGPLCPLLCVSAFYFLIFDIGKSRLPPVSSSCVLREPHARPSFLPSCYSLRFVSFVYFVVTLLSFPFASTPQRRACPERSRTGVRPSPSFRSISENQCQSVVNLCFPVPLCHHVLLCEPAPLPIFAFYIVVLHFDFCCLI